MVSTDSLLVSFLPVLGLQGHLAKMLDMGTQVIVSLQQALIH